MINQASAFDAACAASYLEDYLDCVESLPQDIQGRITKIRKLDSEYCESLNRIKSLRAKFFEIDDDERRKTSILNQICTELSIGQRLSDEQMKNLDFLNEILEVKVRTLDQESRNLESGISDNLFKIVSPNNSQQQNNVLQKQQSNNHHVTNNSRQEKQKIVNHNQQQNSSEESETSNNNSRTSSSTPCQNSAKFAGSAHKRSKRLKYNASQTPLKSNDPPKSRESSVLSNFKDRMNLNHGRCGSATVNHADSDDSQDRILTSGQNSRSKNNQSPASTSFSTTNQNQRRRKKVGGVNNGSKDEDPPAKNGQQQQQPKTPKMKYNLPVDPDEPTYCSCNQVSYGEMIGCDNNECEIEWYHFECVNLISKPKGKWYCPNCRGDRSNIMKDNTNNQQQNL